MLNRVRLWIRSVVLRRRLEREMQEEMAGHLERSTERLMARGLPADEARREARREFGNVTYLQEEARYARGTVWLDALNADLRFALRHFARKPVTTATMMVVLAVGMSISALLFSYVYAYATEPPPGIARADDLVRIRGSLDVGVAERGARSFSDEELAEYGKLTSHFSAVAGWADAMVALDAGDDSGRSGLDARATFVTDGFFRVLGVKPVLGSSLPAGETADPAVAVIGYTAWDQLFGRSSRAIGSTVEVNGVPVTIVGVAPERFIGMGPLARLTLWMPLSARPLVTPGAKGGYRAVARLAPGVRAGEASAAAQVIARRIAAAGPGPVRDLGTGREIEVPESSTEVVPLRSASGDPMFERDVRLMSIMVGFLGLLVLLVACTNVSALLTGLATARRQEIAIRLSLGAGRRRLIRQLLTESALLASVAGAAALAIVWLVTRTVIRLIPQFPLQMGINWPVTLFTFGVALSVGVLFGLSPALHATRIAVASALRDSSASIAAARTRLQRGLVVAQIAFTQPLIVLLAAALLLILGNYEAQTRTALADRLVRVSVRPVLPPPGSSPAAVEGRLRLRQTMDGLVEKLRATPGIDAAVLDWSRFTPALGAYFVHPGDRVPGAAQNAVQLSGETAAGDYFAATSVPLVRGRRFGPADVTPAGPRPSEVPVIVGADLARRLWAGADPVGRRLQAASDTASGARSLVVVGVIDDPRPEVRQAGEGFRVYLPPDTSQLSTALVVRTAGAAEPLLPAIRSIVQEGAPGTGPMVRTLADIEEEGRRSFRMFTFGISAAGLMALLLSAIGLYGVVAFSVTQRRGEIAVRIAVGARAPQIVKKFIGDGLRLSAIGLLIGLPVSLLGLRALLAADDSFRYVPLPSVTAIAALGVLIVASAAAWIPARRAASVDPAITLRGG
jgi:predicted permease